METIVECNWILRDFEKEGLRLHIDGGIPIVNLEINKRDDDLEEYNLRFINYGKVAMFHNTARVREDEVDKQSLMDSSFLFKLNKILELVSKVKTQVEIDKDYYIRVKISKKGESSTASVLSQWLGEGEPYNLSFCDCDDILRLYSKTKEPFLEVVDNLIIVLNDCIKVINNRIERRKE